MFNNIYTFIYEWLFGNGLGALSVQGAEFVGILCTLFILAIGILIVSMPLVWIIRFICGR